MKYYGICPASCGEFVQGVMDRAEYLCSYAVDLYSTAEAEEKLNNINLGPLKSRKAIEAVFKKFNIPVEESKNISLKIRSKIPVGKGMASSTADIGATIGATLGLIKKALNGEVIRYLGNVKDLRVVILEPNSTLNTMRIRKTPNYKKIKTQNKEIIKISFSLLEEGIKSNDMHKIGKASTFSSLANESIHKKEGLEKIIEISKNYGAYGVNVAHSGTVVGILIDKSMNDTRLIELLKNERLDSVYKKMYTSNIIDGGIRGEQTWNTSKIL